MKKWKKMLAIAMCTCMFQSPAVAFADVAADVSQTTTTVGETTELKEGLKTEKGKIYYYENGVKVKNQWRKSGQYNYYFGANGAAYAAPKISGMKQNVLVKKIGSKKYGFDRKGHKIISGVYSDETGTAYVFKKGVLNAKASTKVNKAAKNMVSAKTIRKLLGKPIKTKKYTSCLVLGGKDLKLFYEHIAVQLGQYPDGREVVYGIQCR